MSKERTLAPDVTGSPAGEQLVLAMADGIEDVMLAEGIPFDEGGYDRILRMSRASGELGMIGFRDPANAAKLRDVFFRAVGLLSNRMLPEGAPIPSAAAIRERLRSMGIALDESGALSSEADGLLGRIARTFGEDAKALLLPFVHGDCQRRLVFDELRRRHPGA